MLLTYQIVKLLSVKVRPSHFEKTTAKSKWEGLLKLVAKTKLFHVDELDFVRFIFRYIAVHRKKTHRSLVQPGRKQSSFKDRPSLLPVTVV